MRVVPNLYPALERQEVVVHSPRHVRSFADLTSAELRAVAVAWSERSGAARAEGFDYVHTLINEGRSAGASLLHSHSQLVWLREEPPEVIAERASLGDETCGLCALLERERKEGTRIVAERGGTSMLAAYAGRLPYELLIAGPHDDETAFLASALELLADGIRRLRALAGSVPLNVWLHRGPHSHLELVPRLSVLAGLELGAGIYVNSLAPEQAAAGLRAVTD